MFYILQVNWLSRVQGVQKTRKGFSRLHTQRNELTCSMEDKLLVAVDKGVV